MNWTVVHPANNDLSGMTQCGASFLFTYTRCPASNRQGRQDSGTKKNEKDGTGIDEEGVGVGVHPEIGDTAMKSFPPSSD